MRLLSPKAGSCAFPPAVVGWRKQASSTTPQDAPRDGERIPAGHGMALSHEALSKHVISNEHHLSPIVSQRLVYRQRVDTFSFLQIKTPMTLVSEL